MLPSRRELVKLYSVDLSTVQRALLPLISDGTLEAQTGRGTFVSANVAPVASALNIDEILTRSRARGAGHPISSRSLSNKTIGIIGRLPRFRDDGTLTGIYWVKAIVNAMERSITEAGGATRLFDILRPDEEIVPIMEAVGALRDEKVDGIALVLDYGAEQIAEVIAKLKLRQFPFIYIGQGELRQPVLNVYYDNRDAGQQAADHLLENGCRSLMYFTPYSGETDWETERLVGVREAILLSGLPANSLRTSIGRNNVKEAKTMEQFVYDAREASDALLEAGLPAQGIVAANDYFAHGFMLAAADRGWTAGKDYAIVGFDDEAGSQALGLTSLHPPLEGMGQEAGRLLGNMVAGDRKQSRVCLQSDLVARTSSRLQIK